MLLKLLTASVIGSNAITPMNTYQQNNDEQQSCIPLNQVGYVKDMCQIPKSEIAENYNKNYWLNLVRFGESTYGVYENGTQIDENLKIQVENEKQSHPFITTSKPYNDIKPDEWTDRVGYEIFLRSYAQDNNSVVGNFKGVQNSVNYLIDLGVNELWLTPWFAGPSSHKYDGLNFYSVDPEYGTIDDFKAMASALNKSGIRLMMDIPFNHFSKFSQWFQQGLSDYAKGIDSKYSHWFRFSHERPVMSDGSFADKWHQDPKTHIWYYGAFGDFMPDFNLGSLNLNNEFIAIINYWKNLGVDDFRIDAPKHGFDTLMGDEMPNFTPSEIDQRNTEYWTKFANTIKTYWPDTLVVGEWTGNNYQELNHLAPANTLFNFPWSNDIFNITKNLSAQYNEETNIGTYQEKFIRDLNEWKSLNPTFSPINIIDNHDFERLVSKINATGPNEYKALIAANLLMTVPGMPMIYYGDELAMHGSYLPNVWGGDTNYRLPFPWGPTSNANTGWVNNVYYGSTDHENPPHYFDTVQPHSVIDAINGRADIWTRYKSLIQFHKDYNNILTLFDNIKPIISNNSIFGLEYTKNNETYKLFINLSDGNVDITGIPANATLLHSEGNPVKTNDGYQLDKTGMLFIKI